MCCVLYCAHWGLFGCISVFRFVFRDWGRQDWELAHVLERAKVAPVCADAPVQGVPLASLTDNSTERMSCALLCKCPRLECTGAGGMLLASHTDHDYKGGCAGVVCSFVQVPRCAWMRRYRGIRYCNTMHAS